MNAFVNPRIVGASVVLVAFLTAAPPASSQSDWTTKRPLPTPRRALIAETIDGFIYAGQGNRSGATPDSGRFDGMIRTLIRGPRCANPPPEVSLLARAPWSARSSTPSAARAP